MTTTWPGRATIEGEHRGLVPWNTKISYLPDVSGDHGDIVRTREM